MMSYLLSSHLDPAAYIKYDIKDDFYYEEDESSSSSASSTSSTTMEETCLLDAALTSDDIWSKFDLEAEISRDLLPESSSSSSSSSSESETDEYVLPDLLESTALFGEDLGVAWAEEPSRLDEELKEAEEVESAVTSEDNLRSDCMWSSAFLASDFKANLATGVGHKRPRRDSTLSLMECAESLFKDLDLTLPNAVTTQWMETPMTSSDEEEEEEIDVVSYEHEKNHSHHHYQHRIRHHPKYRKISHGGRSLLKSQQQQQQQHHQQPQQQVQPQQTSLLDHAFGDHSYHLQHEINADSNVMGILTPTESEDDDDAQHCRSTSPKIVRAVHNLMQQTDQEANSNVKFKFRMRFKSTSPQRTTATLGEGRKRRKSASKNPHCPPPCEQIDELKNKKKSKSILTSACVDSSPPPPPPSSFSAGKIVPGEQRCREVRDLHNSMERQRRVDLRNNFDRLKFVVPELKDAGKASKLNILNKSAEYCKYLTATDAKLRKEKDSLNSTREALLKKLSQLQSSVQLSGKNVSVI